LFGDEGELVAFANLHARRVREARRGGVFINDRAV
jgi:hypothetical protein